jgi:hypothetical protein
MHHARFDVPCLLDGRGYRWCVIALGKSSLLNRELQLIFIFSFYFFFFFFFMYDFLGRLG